MLIESLKINGFGKFSEEKLLEFKEGINIVLGDNETGKSTIMACLRATIFGLKTDERNKYEPWNKYEEYSSEVTLRKSEILYRISRDFNTHETAIIRIEGGNEEKLFEGNANPQARGESTQDYYDKLMDIIGIQNDEIFTKVTYIRQQEVETDISPQLRQAISGTRESDYQKIVDSLKDDYHNITKEKAWDSQKIKDRELETLEEEIHNTKQALSESENYLDNSTRLNEEIKNMEEQEEEIKRSLESKNEVVSNLSAFIELKKRESELENEFAKNNEQKSKIENLENIVKGLKEKIDRGFVKYTAYLNYYMEDIADVINLLEKQYELRYSLSQLEEDEVVQPAQKIPPWGYIVSLLPLLIGIMLSILTQSVWGFTLGGFVISILIYFFLHNKYKTKRATEQGKYEGQVGFLHDEDTKISKKLDSFDKQLVTDIKKINTAERKMFLNKLKELHNLVQEMEHFNGILSNLPSREKLTEENNKLIVENVTLQERLEKLTEGSPSLQSVNIDDLNESFKIEEKIRSESRELQNKLGNFSRELNEKRLELKAIQAQSPSSVDILEEKLQMLEERKAFLTSKKEALKLAVDLLQECVDDYQESYIDTLEEYVTEAFARLTGNRYSMTKFDNELVPELTLGDKADISIDQISCGAREQFYFAMRLSVSKLLAEQINLPFILDDPFVNYDENRLNETKKIMDTLSDDHQILLFAHDAKWADWREPVATLK
ncbi:AAA family ATPase [bacterium]|nr:AAA family ATPase [bacterium]